MLGIAPLTVLALLLPGTLPTRPHNRERGTPRVVYSQLPSSCSSCS